MDIDYSDWLNDIVPKHPSESEGEYYNRHFAMRLRVELEYQRKRCVNCEYYSEGTCGNFFQEVTYEQACTPNNCDAYSEQIPF